MAKKKFVVGCFDDEDVLFPAVKKVRKAGYKIQDVYTSFPVHGLDHALGMRETSLHTAGFIYGITGTTTVLFAAVGMVMTFCYLCQLAPFVKRHHFHPRATDDYFVMVIECTDKTNVDDLKGFVQNAGAIEVD